MNPIASGFRWQVRDHIRRIRALRHSHSLMVHVLLAACAGFLLQSPRHSRCRGVPAQYPKRFKNPICEFEASGSWN